MIGTALSRVAALGEGGGLSGRGQKGAFSSERNALYLGWAVVIWLFHLSKHIKLYT